MDDSGYLTSAHPLFEVEMERRRRVSQTAFGSLAVGLFAVCAFLVAYIPLVVILYVQLAPHPPPFNWGAALVVGGCLTPPYVALRLLARRLMVGFARLDEAERRVPANSDARRLPLPRGYCGPALLRRSDEPTTDLLRPHELS